ncbi:MAG: tRNA (N(6)-L-threonylcarbamoyladenosine(37)-C(2))-methylthiotransferase MtaB [Desulfuromonadales bacterium]|nr:tRNA (N(6)-L-threonylcarbamoyladenosine(37)-C(2))-methylthiotransferase MtaB [Desulfuromonadales bacterium]
MEPSEPSATAPSVAFATLGCKTNQFESAAMQEQLSAAGYRAVPFADGADLVIVNTCTVTNATDAQSRNLIRRARRLNPGCRVVVTGCYAQVDPQALASLPGVAVVIGNDEKRRLLDYVVAESTGQTIAVGDIRTSRSAVAPPPLTSFAGRSRAFVQIQNGCDAFCSYCIIPFARGVSRSSAVADVEQQVVSLLAAGYAEIVLTGIHIGGYGKDLSPPVSLLQLLQSLLEKTGVRRLRLGSIEPTELPDALLDLVANSAAICPHFHVPLQSGDNAVLRRMQRTYDRELFRERIMAIHARLPHAGIGLDVITGFPGETEQEFANTCRLIEGLPVSDLHVFPYSRRPGTVAAAFADQVPGDVSRQRAESLRQLAAAKQRAFAGRFIGETLEVVVENSDDGMLRGVSRNYLDVCFAGPNTVRGQAVPVRIVGIVDDHLTGELLAGPKADDFLSKT